MEKERGAINGQGQREDGGGRELEKEKKRIHHCSCVLIAIKSGTRLKGVMRR